MIHTPKKRPNNLTPQASMVQLKTINMVSVMKEHYGMPLKNQKLCLLEFI